MSSPSSPESNNNNLPRGKTTFHGLKATPKVLRPVQPQHVYDSYDDEPRGHKRREERRPRRSSGPADLASLGMFAFFGVMALGVVFYLVQGASTMPYDNVGDTIEDVRKKNEETRRLNEQRAREAAQMPKPVEREAPVIPPTAKRDVPATPTPTAAPGVRPAVEVRPERPTPIGGISAGMVPPELQPKVQAEPSKDAPDAQVPTK